MEIKKAINICNQIPTDPGIAYSRETDEAIYALIALAEKYLSVEGKMPGKREVRHETTKKEMNFSDGIIKTTQQDIHYDKEAEAFNQAREMCILAVVKILPTVETIAKNLYDADQPRVNGRRLGRNWEDIEEEMTTKPYYRGLAIPIHALLPTGDG